MRRFPMRNQLRGYVHGARLLLQRAQRLEDAIIEDIGLQVRIEGCLALAGAASQPHGARRHRLRGDVKNREPERN